MKHMRKLSCLLMALIMILSLAVPVFAEDGKFDSITVSNAKPGETYSLYKLFDLEVDSETAPEAFSYTINSGWAAFFAVAQEGTQAGAGRQYITVNAAGYVTAISDPAALAKAAAAWSSKPAATKSVSVPEGESTAVFSGLEDAYWLITSTLGTVAMTETSPANSAVSVEEKNPEDTIEKKVKEDSTGAFGKSNDVQIGDTVEFQSVVKIVKGTRNVVVHDRMTSGLTYTAGSVAISGLTKGTEYTVDEAPGDGDTFDITFAQNWIDGLDFGTEGYKEYTIAYTATLNENAVAQTEGQTAVVDQTNTTHVSFGNATSSTEDTTTTTTHKFAVFKHAKDSTDNLADAIFKLKKGDDVVKLIKLDDNNYRVAKAEENGAVETFTTVSDGDIVIWGVDSDEYRLEETEAPAGFNKLDEDVAVTVDANNSTQVDVENNAGTELPSTGGIGTTVFYVLGGILVTAAVVLLVTRKRMSSDQ